MDQAENIESKNASKSAADRILRESPTFRDVDPELINDLIAISINRVLQPGTHLYRPGDAYKEAVYILHRGEVEIRRNTGDIYRVIPGDFIGLSSYLDSSAHASSAVALSEAEILELPAERLHDLEKRSPALYNLLNRFIAKRIRNWSPSKQAGTGVLARPVRSAMRAPLSTVYSKLSVREAYEKMRDRKIGSVGVIRPDGTLHGMLTFKALAEAVIMGQLDIHANVVDAVTEDPHCVSPDTPLWRAEEIQHHNGVKYLIVEDEGKPIGMISQTDIIRALITQQSTVTHKIDKAGSHGELAEIYQGMAHIAAEARDSNRRPSTALRMTSDTHLAIQRRCTELTVEEMQTEGYGEAPIPYALIIMGSGGRQEMMLAPDQDNGIILADTPETETSDTRAWFGQFCNRLNENLAATGYVLCKGNIMCRNPMFHKTLSQWKHQISHMADFPNQKAARWSNIVFDFDTFYGDDSLTIDLRKHVHTELARKPKLLQLMVEDDAEGRPPIGWFNRLVTTDTDDDQQGKIDIKRNGLRIIADAARIFALNNGIHSCNTTDRLNSLLRLGVMSADFVDSVHTAYEELIDLLLIHQIFAQLNNRKPSKYIDPAKLTSRARETLRESMLAVKRFQDTLQGEFS